MKPEIKRFQSKWVCLTAAEDNIFFDRYNQLTSTQSETIGEAFRKWYESVRKYSAWIAGDRMAMRLFQWNATRMIAEKCITLIGHDRYLISVDSRERKS